MPPAVRSSHASFGAHGEPEQPRRRSIFGASGPSAVMLGGATFVDDHKVVSRALRNYARGIVHPRNAGWLRYWDGVSFCCLFYTASVTPFEICLLEATPLTGLTDDVPSLILFIVNRLVDLFFTCDVILNFFLAYQEPAYKGGMWVTSRGRIFKHYLRTWLTIDVISIVPFDLLMSIDDSRSEDLELLRIVRILRLLRLVKLLRILRASRIITRWQNYVGVSFAQLTMVRFLTMTMFVVHFMACGWAYVGINWEPTAGQTLDWESSWLEYYGFDELQSTRRLYVISLYVAVCAMFGSVGSISPRNYAEYVMITTMMLIGSSIWAWVIGSLCGILATLNPHATAFRNLMDELNFFMRMQNFDNEHRARLRDFFRNTQDFNRMRAYDKLMLNMSAQLRGETALRIGKSSLEGIWYFNSEGCEQEFLSLVALNFHQTVFEAREVLPSIDLTVVDRGTVARRLVMLTRGAVIGTDCVIPDRYFGLRPLEAAYTLTFVQTATISRTTLSAITEHFPMAQATIHNAAMIYTLNAAFRKAWTLHKRLLRAQGKARACVSNCEVHEGALKYSHASAVLAAFAGAGSGVGGVASTGSAMLELQRRKKEDKAKHFRRKNQSTVGQQLGFQDDMDSTFKRRVSVCVSEQSMRSVSTSVMGRHSPLNDGASTRSPLTDTEASSCKRAATVIGSPLGDQSVRTVAMGIDFEVDESDDDFGSGEEIHRELRDLRRKEEERTDELTAKHDALRAEVQSSMDAMHQKLNGLLSAFGTLERIHQAHAGQKQGGYHGGEARGSDNRGPLEADVAPLAAPTRSTKEEMPKGRIARVVSSGNPDGVERLVVRRRKKREDNYSRAKGVSSQDNGPSTRPVATLNSVGKLLDDGKGRPRGRSSKSPPAGSKVPEQTKLSGVLLDA